MNAIIKQDPHYLEQRRKEMQPYLDAFSTQMARVYQIMPTPKRTLNLKTGEWGIIQDEKWQAIVDKLFHQQREYLKTSFPEFFEFENEKK